MKSFFVKDLFPSSPLFRQTHIPVILLIFQIIISFKVIKFRSVYKCVWLADAGQTRASPSPPARLRSSEGHRSSTSSGTSPVRHLRLPEDGAVTPEKSASDNAALWLSVWPSCGGLIASTRGAAPLYSIWISFLNSFRKRDPK